jgi:DNA-binding transcriptional MerR regulator
MQLLEVMDVARALHVSPASVRRYADEGVLPVAAETPRRVRLFDAADVERLRATREARRRALDAVVEGSR